ncbi:MAG: DUF697 domain-containing protein [Saprospiraceae bacterium]|nr:DUF697 domain-containing protein [Saprospiraceae bacterium]
MTFSLTPGKLFPLLTLFDLIEHEKSFSKAMTKEEKQAKASEIIKNHVGFSLGAALIPLPGADLLAVSGVQLNMLRQLAKLYGVSFFDALGKNIVSAIVGSSAARLGASLVKAIPGVGTIIGELSMPVLSGASTWALGRTVAKHFHRGGTLEDLDLTKARQSYETEMEEGKKVAVELRQTESPATRSESDETIDKIKKLAEMKEAGILTDDEFKQLKERLLSQI